MDLSTRRRGLPINKKLAIFLFIIGLLMLISKVGHSQEVAKKSDTTWVNCNSWGKFTGKCHAVITLKDTSSGCKCNLNDAKKLAARADSVRKAKVVHENVDVNAKAIAKARAKQDSINKVNRALVRARQDSAKSANAQQDSAMRYLKFREDSIKAALRSKLLEDSLARASARTDSVNAANAFKSQIPERVFTFPSMNQSIIVHLPDTVNVKHSGSVAMTISDDHRTEWIIGSIIVAIGTGWVVWNNTRPGKVAVNVYNCTNGGTVCTGGPVNAPNGMRVAFPMPFLRH